MANKVKEGSNLTPCGRMVDHTPHTFTSQRGKVIICDGVLRSEKTRDAKVPSRP